MVVKTLVSSPLLLEYTAAGYLYISNLSMRLKKKGLSSWFYINFTVINRYKYCVDLYLYNVYKTQHVSFCLPTSNLRTRCITLVSIYKYTFYTFQTIEIVSNFISDLNPCFQHIYFRNFYYNFFFFQQRLPFNIMVIWLHHCYNY